MRQIVLDTETTGLDAASGDRVIEIGCVELLARQPGQNHLHLYLNPDRDSHPDALRVHGLTTEFLSDKPRFADVAHDFVRYISGAELIIHNAPFDEGFLDMELQRAGLPPLRGHVRGIVDTLAMARELYPGKRCSLDALCERLEIDNSHRTLHGALMDARLLADVYILLTRGQNDLLMDDSAAGGAGRAAAHADFSGLSLPVVPASPQERQAHASVLLGIDKASGNQTLWRKVLPEENAAA